MLVERVLLETDKEGSLTGCHKGAKELLTTL